MHLIMEREIDTYRIGLEPVTSKNIREILEIFRVHYGNQKMTAQHVVASFGKWYNQHDLLWAGVVRNRAGELCLCVPVVRGRHPEHVFMSHIVTHSDHRRKGLLRSIKGKITGMLAALGIKEVEFDLFDNEFNHYYKDDLNYRTVEGCAPTKGYDYTHSISY